MSSEIKVFRVDDYHWFAGTSLEECLNEARAHYDIEPNDESFELTADDMERLKFTTEDGDTMTFAEQLEILKNEDTTFPTIFATTEW